MLSKLHFIITVDSRYLNSKGLAETLWDIRTSTYQSWESKENNKSNNHISQMNM